MGILAAVRRLLKLANAKTVPRNLDRVIGCTARVTEDIDNLKANTAIAAMMSLLNAIADTGAVTKGELRTLTLLLNPFAPHMTEELWEQMGFGGTVTDQQWPAYDEAKCKDETVEIVVQLNGKVRAKLSIPAEMEAADAIALAKQEEKIKAAIENMQIVKEIYVKGKLVNLVVKPQK